MTSSSSRPFGEGWRRPRAAKPQRRSRRQRRCPPLRSPARRPSRQGPLNRRRSASHPSRCLPSRFRSRMRRMWRNACPPRLQRRQRSRRAAKPNRPRAPTPTGRAVLSLRAPCPPLRLQRPPGAAAFLMPILPRWRTSSRRRCVVPPRARRRRDAARFRRPPSHRHKNPRPHRRNPRKHRHRFRRRRQWRCRRLCPCRRGPGRRDLRNHSRSLPRRVHPPARLRHLARDRARPRSPAKPRGRKILSPHPTRISRRRARRRPLNRRAPQGATRPISIPSRPKWRSCLDARRCRAKRIPDLPDWIEAAVFGPHAAAEIPRGFRKASMPL
jgi:hypothetical protein